TRPLARHGEPGQEKLTFETVAKIRAVAERLGVPMADLSLAWLLKQPGVTSVLVGARNPEQLRENARAAELSLSEEVVQELSRITEPLKEAFGPNPDMWQGKSRYR
ncbi:MAG: aldo/keto reductase, partial [Calditrichaeota bacterium]|nr:aldo/keto reductase [Calditrichota bacterium]